LPRLAVGILVTLCAAKLLLHLFTSVRHYGYFRDELYYLDMARHLDWGYVDAISALRPLPALWHGRGKQTNVSLPRCPLRHPENLVALTSLELGKLGLGKYVGDAPWDVSRQKSVLN